MDLSAYIGQTVTLVWEFDSIDGNNNDSLGWQVDAIEVVAEGTIDHDCNTNSIPDDCDIAAGTSLNCNSNSIPDECETIDAGDFDADTDVDLVDFAAFTDCLAGPDNSPTPPSPECAQMCLDAFDDDDDADVDLDDFAAFQAAFTGP